MLEIVDRPIDMHELYEAVRNDACGAIVVFVGAVRNRSDDDRPVSGLGYEAYGKAAVAEMEIIAQEVRERWPGCELAMMHRTGSLNVGEPSVAVAAATPHRHEAFEACRYAIDELKERVPIWKKERYLDGDESWRENAGRGEVSH